MVPLKSTMFILQVFCDIPIAILLGTRNYFGKASFSQIIAFFRQHTNMCPMTHIGSPTTCHSRTTWQFSTLSRSSPISNQQLCMKILPVTQRNFQIKNMLLFSSSFTTDTNIKKTCQFSTPLYHYIIPPLSTPNQHSGDSQHS